MRHRFAQLRMVSPSAEPLLGCLILALQADFAELAWCCCFWPAGRCGGWVVGGRLAEAAVEARLDPHRQGVDRSRCCGWPNLLCRCGPSGTARELLISGWRSQAADSAHLGQRQGQDDSSVLTLLLLWSPTWIGHGRPSPRVVAVLAVAGAGLSSALAYLKPDQRRVELSRVDIS